MKKLGVSFVLTSVIFHTSCLFGIINALRRATYVVPKQALCVMPVAIKCAVEPQLPSFDIRHDLFEIADLYFKDTEGYEKVIRDIRRVYATNPAFLKGFLFELEKAIMLVERGEEIQALHKDIYDPLSESLKDKREVDILTQRYAVECKYYKWASLLPEQRQKVKNQLMAQKKIVCAHNAYYGTCHDVLLCSKTPIPQNMKQWLYDCDIPYEDPSTISS